MVVMLLCCRHAGTLPSQWGKEAMPQLQELYLYNISLSGRAASCFPKLPQATFTAELPCMSARAARPGLCLCCLQLASVCCSSGS